MITLSKENLLDLSQYIDNLPTKYGLPLIQFLEKLKREQTPKEEAAPNEEKKAVAKSKKSSK